MKKGLRKSLTFDILEDEQSRMNFYLSSGDLCEIDPDIAKDLFSMKNINK